MIVIINTGVGNFKSVMHMLARTGVESIVSDRSEDIEIADKLILPGVGSFDMGMAQLSSKNLIDIIKYKVKVDKTKILGICLGMQMLADYSDEGTAKGLSLISGRVKKLVDLGINGNLKIPHMGWNYVIPKQDSVLFKDFSEVPKFYFTHSYYVSCQAAENCIAETTHGISFCSAINQDNIYGVQFHPEKSHRYGLQLLSNFAKC